MKPIFRYFQAKIKLQKSKMSNVAADYSPIRPVLSKLCSRNSITKLKILINSYEFDIIQYNYKKWNRYLYTFKLKLSFKNRKCQTLLMISHHFVQFRTDTAVLILLLNLDLQLILISSISINKKTKNGNYILIFSSRN